MGDERDQVHGLKLLLAAGSLLDRVTSTLRHSELFDSTYAIRARVKSEARLLDKIEQKRREGRPAYSVSDVTDIIGIRLINLYRQDVPGTVDALLGLVFGDLEVSPNILSSSSLFELISYTSNSLADSDPINVEIRRIYKDKYEVRSNIKFKQIERSRYSSVHMVITLPFRFEKQDHLIPIEVQVRSGFEDTWAEIDHQLLLELGRYGEPVDETHRKTVAQHMGVLKKMMDAAADYADVIRRTVVQSSEPPALIQRSLDGTDYVNELCARLDIPEPMRKQLMSILATKAALDKDLTDGQSTSSELQYVEIAQKLAELSPSIESIAGDAEESGSRHLVYLAKMEEALCRLLSNQSDQLKLALSIYQDITARFPRYPVGWFRMGQTYQRMSDTSDDITGLADSAARAAHDSFAQARRRLAEIQRQPDDARILFISPAQEHYIRDHAARLQAFVLWRLSDRRRRMTAKVTQRDFEDVLVALRVTEAALNRGESPDVEGRIANGIAFYVVDVIGLVEKLKIQRPRLPSMARVRELITKVEQNPPSTRDRVILHWDTIVRVREFLGEIRAAKVAATQILDLASEEEMTPSLRAESSYVSEAKSRAVQHAWKVVRPTAG